MTRRIASLLVLLAIGISLLALSSAAPTVTAIPQLLREDLPAGTFVARIYYHTLSDLDQLSAYDLWEYNNLEQRYVLVSLDAAEYINLEKKGWQLQVDQRHSANLRSAVSPFASGYRTVSEIYTALDQLNSQYPQLTELLPYGQSTCLAQGGCTTLGGETSAGFDLIALRISNEQIPGVSSVDSSPITRGSKPVFFLLANIHAREIATPEIAMNLAEELLSNYGKDADITWLVDWHEIWIVPLANPDGHWLVELGGDPIYNRGAFFQRKNANLDADDDDQPDCSVWPPLVSTQYGVDLNRNHSYEWGTIGASSEACDQTYRGPAPASEHETNHLQTLVRALIPDQRTGMDAAPPSTSGLLITMHSFGDLILWPWGHDAQPAPNHAGLKAIGDKLATFSGYESCQASTCLYYTSGTTDDWAYGELGIPAFTYEIGETFMPVFDEIEKTLWPQNLPSLLYAARIARTPYETIQGPNVNNLHTNISTTEGTLHINATIDDSHHGDHDIAAASFSIDLPYWAEGANTQPLPPQDGLFDSPTEQVAAVIDLGTLEPGQHILYVNGMDDEGHWGLTAAEFVIIPDGRSPHVFIPININS